MSGGDVRSGEEARSRPVLLIGRRGQVASALQRLAPRLLPGRPLLAVGRPELDLAQTATPTSSQAAGQSAAKPVALEAQLQELLERLQPALLINAAAYTAVDRAESEAELARAINGEAVGVMARLCAQRALPLIHLSTDYVFDGSGERPWRPQDPPAPLGVYGASKLLGEQLVAAAGGPALVLRVSWVFGQEGANFVRTMLRLAAEREELRVVADQVGGPTSAEAIARTLLQLAEPAISGHLPTAAPPAPAASAHQTSEGLASQGRTRADQRPDQPTAPEPAFPWGLHHFQGQPLVSWHGFAEAIVQQAYGLGLLQRQPRVVAIGTADFPTPARRPANSRLDCSSFTAAFGLELPDWRDDLQQCLRSWLPAPSLPTEPATAPAASPAASPPAPSP